MNKTPPIFDWKPRPFQQQIISGQKPVTLIRCSRQVGKTDLCAFVAGSALLSSPKAISIAVTSFSLKNAKAVIWTRLREMLMPFPGHIEERKSEDTITNNETGSVARLHGLSAEHGDSIRGFSYDLVIVDEYPKVPYHIFVNAMLPTLSATKGWLLAIGTPTGSFDLMMMMESEARQNPDTHAAFHFPASALVGQVPHLKPEWLATQRRRNPLTYALEYEADISAAASDTIFDSELLSNCLTYDPPTVADSLAVHAGLDFAPRGDRCILLVRNSLNVIAVIELSYDRDPHGFIKQVKRYIDEYTIRFLTFDRGGAGEVLGDMLETALSGYWPIEDARAVLSGNRPYHDSNFNCRSELYSLVRDYLHTAKVPVQFQELLNELSATRQKFNDSGKFQVVSKEAIIEVIGSSPDIADALSLSMFHERAMSTWSKPAEELTPADLSSMSTAEIIEKFSHLYE